MKRSQKVAWFIVINFTVAITLAVVGYLVLSHIFGPRAAYASFGFLGLCGVSGFAPLIFKRTPAVFNVTNEIY